MTEAREVDRYARASVLWSWKSLSSVHSIGLLLVSLLFLRIYPVQYIGLFGARVIDAAFAAAMMTYVIIKRPSFCPKVLTAIAIMLVMAALVLVSGITAPYRLDVDVSVRDLAESMRYVTYAVLLGFGHSLATDRNFDAARIAAVVFGILALSAAFTLAQRFFPDALREVTNFYAPEHQARRVMTTSRPTGFYGNPNTNGLVLLLFLAAAISYLRVFGVSRSMRRKCLAVVIILLGVMSVIATGSSTALVTLLSVLLVVLVLRRFWYGFFLGSVLIASILFFNELILEAVRYSNTYYYHRLQPLLTLDFTSLFVEGGLSGRLSHWQQAMPFFIDAPFIGGGPLRGEIISSTDNFYIYILARYGVAGFLVFLAFWAVVWLTAYKALRSADRSVSFLAWSVLSSSVAVAVSNLVLEAQILIPVAYFYFIFVGMLMGRQNAMRKAT